MSSFNRANAVSRQRPHHFHDGPDQHVQAEAEAEQPLPVESDGQSPAVRLYRHALESIFGFLSLRELAIVLAVSHSWAAAVASMRSIGAVILQQPAKSVLCICTSQLARHIGTLGSKAEPCFLSLEVLCLASLRLTGLRTLHCKLPSLKGPLLFPPSLTQLQLCPPEDATPVDLNLLIVSVARLPHLKRAALWLVHVDPLVSLAPFGAAPHLRELGVFGDGYKPNHIEEIQSMTHLTELMGVLCALDARRILRAPHELQWQILRVQDLTAAELVEVQASLPKLTEVNAEAIDSISFLQSVPTLRTLTLSAFARTLPLQSPEQMVEGVGQCKQLTHLNLWGNILTAAHVGALLTVMPLLSELKLNSMQQLESLSFLSVAPLCNTLTSFTLQYCRHAQLLAKELSHLYDLQQLTSLCIVESFAEKLDSWSVHELQVPSKRLPKLLTSTIEGAAPILEVEAV